MHTQGGLKATTKRGAQVQNTQKVYAFWTAVPGYVLLDSREKATGGN